MARTLFDFQWFGLRTTSMTLACSCYSIYIDTNPTACDEGVLQVNLRPKSLIS